MIPEPCRYCGGDCSYYRDNMCDGYSGDIDGLYSNSFLYKIRGMEMKEISELLKTMNEEQKRGAIDEIQKKLGIKPLKGKEL